LNFAGIGPELVPYVVDRNPHKVGKLLPGSRIPVVPESQLRNDRPDFIVVFPWNLIREIASQLVYAREWNAKLVTAVPDLAFWDP
jgi:hypothetical protein